MQDARLVEAAPAEITAEDSAANIKSQTNVERYRSLKAFERLQSRRLEYK